MGTEMKTKEGKITFPETPAFKLKPEIKEKWLAALRSDDYEQGCLFLCDHHNGTTQFCCLGVLEEILGTPYKREPRDRELAAVTPHYDYVRVYADGVKSALTIDTTRNIAAEGYAFDNGGKLNTPVTFMEEQFSTLYGLNDRGMPFELIADIIERQF